MGPINKRKIKLALANTRHTLSLGIWITWSTSWTLGLKCLFDFSCSQDTIISLTTVTHLDFGSPVSLVWRDSLTVGLPVTQASSKDCVPNPNCPTLRICYYSLQRLSRNHPLPISSSQGCIWNSEPTLLLSFFLPFLLEEKTLYSSLAYRWKSHFPHKLVATAKQKRQLACHNKGQLEEPCSKCQFLHQSAWQAHYRGDKNT